jgi:hypothetical protein
MMINEYKRHDVFRCSQEAHKRFEGNVSVYHVLKEKSCYPQGCLYFGWHCVLLEKGNRCIHRYQYVGKNCKGCTYFTEEKIHFQPELLLNEDEYKDFLEELGDFETWLDSVRFKRQSLGGQIDCVKPWFEQILQHKANHVQLRGYLLVFKKGFIDKELFEDTFYVRVSEKLMQTFQFVPRMKVEMEGELREDRGRIIIYKPRKVEVMENGFGNPLNREQVLVAIKTSTHLKDQPEQCLACPWGALIDVVDRRSLKEKWYRNLYCMKGVVDPDMCAAQVLESLDKK